MGNLRGYMCSKTIAMLLVGMTVIEFSGIGNAMNRRSGIAYADENLVQNLNGNDEAQDKNTGEWDIQNKGDESQGLAENAEGNTDGENTESLGKVQNENAINGNVDSSAENTEGNTSNEKTESSGKNTDGPNTGVPGESPKNPDKNTGNENTENTDGKTPKVPGENPGESPGENPDGNIENPDGEVPSENPGEDIEDDSVLGAPIISSFVVDKGENCNRLKLSEVSGSNNEYEVSINATEELKVCERSDLNKTLNKWFGIVIKSNLNNNNKLSYSFTGDNFKDLNEKADTINYFMIANRTGAPSYTETKHDSIIYLKYSGTSDDSAIRITIHYIPFKSEDKPSDGDTSTAKLKSVSISGIHRVGKTLTAKITYDGKSPSVKPNISYQWLRASKKDGEYKEISSADEVEYKLKSADEDCYIKVRVTLSGSVNETKESSRTGSIDEKYSSSGSSGSSSGIFDDFDKDDLTIDSDKLTDEEMYVNTSYSSEVDKEMFELIKEYGYKSLVLEGSNCLWTFKCNDMKNLSKMKSKFDAQIDNDSPNESEISRVTNGTNVVNIHFNYAGVLPGKATVQVDVGSEYDGNNRYVYYYNTQKKLLELVSSNVDVKKGKATFEITHCSDYVLSETPIAGSVSSSTFDENSIDVDAGINETINSGNSIFEGNGNILGNYGQDENSEVEGQADNKYNSSNSTWKQLQNGDWQLLFNGLLVVGWTNMDNNWYYMNEFGVMQTGWIKSNGNYYYLSEYGVMQIGWQHINGKLYYFNEDGDMAIGWKCLKGVWYYLNNSGVMEIGWQNIDGNWYYLYPDGAMAYSVEMDGHQLSESGVMY